MPDEEPRCPERTPFSFELFPPRNDAAGAELRETIRRLASAAPDFMSVTYGANGSSRRSSLEVLRYIHEHTAVDPLAHLTCVGSSHFEANRLVREFLDAGITRFLALRGDPPRGSVEGEQFLGDLGSASELVQLIHRVQTERAQYASVQSTRVQPTSAAVVARIPSVRSKVQVAVAAFPNGHPRSRHALQDIDTLLAKQVAGATFAITQLFFHADDYLGFVSKARDAGVTIPVIPGIMPMTSSRRLERTIELTDERLPVELARNLESAGSVEAQFEVGVSHATALAEEVLRGGAPALHLYTFNQHTAALSVLDGVGLLPAAPTSATPTPVLPTPKENETV